ncbi:sulfotransferase domain-containing protein [Phormidium tenue FACHB-886]|nr:sulfotransferase domain-containing protein [Phormidium tenue FACHB-886]
MDEFTRWSNHVISWCNAPVKSFLLLKYEDMQTNCVQELTRFLNFSNIPIDTARIQRVVAACEFDRMQKIEKEQTALAGLFRDSDTTASFIREGRAGIWMEFFSNDLLVRFIEVHGEALEHLGYLSPRITQAIQQLQQNLQQAQATQQQAEAELKKLTIDCQQLGTELQHSQSQIQQLQLTIQQIDRQARKRRGHLRKKVNNLEAEIAAMKSSKFWKLRKLWFQLKGIFDPN